MLARYTVQRHGGAFWWGFLITVRYPPTPDSKTYIAYVRVDIGTLSIILGGFTAFQTSGLFKKQFGQLHLCKLVN